MSIEENLPGVPEMPTRTDEDTEAGGNRDQNPSKSKPPTSKGGRLRSRWDHQSVADCCTLVSLQLRVDEAEGLEKLKFGNSFCKTDTHGSPGAGVPVNP